MDPEDNPAGPLEKWKQDIAWIRSWPNILHRLGFSPTVNARTVLAAGKSAGLTTGQAQRIPVPHLFRLLEAKARALEVIEQVAGKRDLRATGWAKATGGRPESTANGSLVRRLRKACDVQQLAFASMCGIHISTLQRVEKEHHGNDDTLRAILKTLRRLGYQRLTLEHLKGLKTFGTQKLQ